MRRERLEITVVQDHKALEIFLRLPWQIYEGNHCWIPPLLKSQREFFTRRNTFFQHAEMKLFLAKLNDKWAGRIAGIVDHEFVRVYQERVGYFGFFECIPDYRVAEALLSAVESFVKGRRMDKICGPFSPSVHDEVGLLIEGYDLSPCILMPYNHPYYVTFIERYGFRKAKDLLAFTVDLKKPLDSIHLETIRRLEEQGVRLRPMNRKASHNEIQLLRRLYNTTFMASHHWGFVPMSSTEAHARYNSFKAFLVPELIWFAEAHDLPVGFFFNLPDLNPALKTLNGKLGLLNRLWFRPRTTTVRSLAIGVLSDYAGKGIASGLLASAITTMQKIGYTDLEWSWVAEDNLQSIHLITKFGGYRYKAYRVFERSIKSRK